MSDTANKWSCKPCLQKAIASVTRDKTATSDSKRAHVAFERGWDRTQVNGAKKVVQFPKSPSGIFYTDVLMWCDAMAEAGMRPSTLAVYRSTFERAWAVVNCSHPIVPPSSGATYPAPVGVFARDSNPSRVSSQPSATSSDTIAALLGGGGEGPVACANDASSSGSGFRLSVAQKGCSLVLKWGWINGEIPMPPVCPIDRIMLDRATRITGYPWSINWTAVNSLAEWDDHFAHLKRAAGNTPIAAWEIIQFEGGDSDAKMSFKERQARDIIARILQKPETVEEPDDIELKIEEAKSSFMARFGKGGPGHDRWAYDMLSDALKSSLGHNPTYHPNTSESKRSEIREEMKVWLLKFFIRWRDSSPSEQTVERFRQEIVDFRDHMNELFSQYFR